MSHEIIVIPNGCSIPIHGRRNSQTVLARGRNWAGSENLARKERFGSQHERSYYLGTSRTKKQRIKLKDFRKGSKKSEES